jgi:hypothetical protein
MNLLCGLSSNDSLVSWAFVLHFGSAWLIWFPRGSQWSLLVLPKGVGGISLVLEEDLFVQAICQGWIPPIIFIYLLLHSWQGNGVSLPFYHLPGDCGKIPWPVLPGYPMSLEEQETKEPCGPCLLVVTDGPCQGCLTAKPFSVRGRDLAVGTESAFPGCLMLSASLVSSPCWWCQVLLRLSKALLSDLGRKKPTWAAFCCASGDQEMVGLSHLWLVARRHKRPYHCAISLVMGS